MAGWTQRDLDHLRKRRAGELMITKISEARENTRSRARKRTDLKDQYFRSMWEANIARLLNLWQGLGIVAAWEYETEEFEFHKIKRGCRFYKIDFKIRFVKNPTEPIYWEVKGYWDSKSKTKLKRMAKYYPHVRIEVIDSTQYQVLKRQWAGLIPTWETRGDTQQSAA